MNNKISIGIIGFGNIGKKRFEALIKLKNLAEVKVICDSKNIKSKFKKIKFIKNINEIENFTLDLIIICTPTDVTKKIYGKFVGKYHLLIEKPITLNLRELKNNITKSLKKKKILQGGYNLKHDNGLIFLKKKLLSLKIGKIYYCNITYANGTAKTNTNNVGSVYDMASHSINLLMWLFDQKNIKVLSTSVQKNEFSNIYPDNGFAILKFKKILINLHHGFCSWKNNFSLQIHGSLGSLKVSSLPKWGQQTIKYEKRIFPSGKPKVILKKFKNDFSFKNELNVLLNNIKNLNVFNIKKINHESLNTLRILNLLNK